MTFDSDVGSTVLMENYNNLLPGSGLLWQWLHCFVPMFRCILFSFGLAGFSSVSDIDNATIRQMTRTTNHIFQDSAARETSILHAYFIALGYIAILAMLLLAVYAVNATQQQKRDDAKQAHAASSRSSASHAATKSDTSQSLEVTPAAIAGEVRKVR
jgi:hypothetical protein